MSRVDPLSRTLIIDGTRMLKFDKEDVARVFGIPCGGKLVSQLSMTQEVIGKVMDGYLGSQMADHKSIKAAQEVVEREYGAEMTTEEENAFKGAFVIYIVSMVLSPGTKYDHTTFDYWDALVDPNAIHTFDWCEYVVCRLFDAVVKVKADIRGSSKAASITGCSLFLQVLYLDSIDTGVLKMEHNSFPRVRHFGQSTMTSMILADTLSDFDDMTGCLFGQSKFRPYGEVCYHWASQPCRHVHSQLNGTHHMLWESARDFAAELIVPGEVAGPLFFALVDSYNHTRSIRPDAGLKVTAIMVTIISHYRQGFRYFVGSQDLKRCIFDVICQQCTSLGDQLKLGKKEHASSSACACTSMWGNTSRFSVREVENSFALLFGGPIARFVEDSPVELVKHLMAVRAMSRFYISVRSRSYNGCIDLNKRSVKYEDDTYFSARRVSVAAPVVKSPWQLGIRAGLLLDHNASTDLIKDKICEFLNEKLKCIVHYVPKYIEVGLSSIKMALDGLCEMELDMFDAAIRRLKEIDDEVYTVSMAGRWRHLFESDFLGSILAGSFDINDYSIRAQLMGGHLEYDISKCKMLFFPGVVEQRWVCYAWCLDSNMIMVFDPYALKCLPNGVVMVHKQVACAIKVVMEEVVSKLPLSWEYEWKAASITMLRMAVVADECTNRTGLMCAQFCFSFNGSGGDTAQFIDASSQAFATLIGEIAKLSCNHGLIHEVIDL